MNLYAAREIFSTDFVEKRPRSNILLGESLYTVSTFSTLHTTSAQSNAAYKMRIKFRAATLTFCAVMLMTSGCYRSTANTPSQEPNVVLGALNINTATAEELVTIPNIGEKLAVRIVEFRERNGRFQRPEDLLLVPGISDKRFREIRNMIRTE